MVGVISTVQKALGFSRNLSLFFLIACVFGIFVPIPVLADLHVSDHRGVFLSVGDVRKAEDGNQLTHEFAESDAISGFSLSIPWNLVQPRSREEIRWRALNIELKRALENNKKLNLIIVAADHTPKWIKKDPNIETLTFNVERGRGVCIEGLKLAVPWDPDYIREFVEVHRKLRDHLIGFHHNGKSAYEIVSRIKLGFLGQHGGELRLPAYFKDKFENCDVSGAQAEWMKAEYTPSKVTTAYNQVLSEIASLFPDKVISQGVLQSDGFPLIGEDGQPTSRGSRTTSTTIISESVALLGERYAVQHNGLNPFGYARKVTWARDLGATIGWQTNLFGGKSGSGCGNPEHNNNQAECSRGLYRKMLRLGTRTGGSFLEVWAVDLRDANLVGVIRETNRVLLQQP